MASIVPIEWHVTGGTDEKGKAILDLHVSITSKLSWIGLMGKENEYITNYVLRNISLYNPYFMFRLSSSTSTWKNVEPRIMVNASNL